MHAVMQVHYTENVNTSCFSLIAYSLTFMWFNFMNDASGKKKDNSINCIKVTSINFLNQFCYLVNNYSAIVYIHSRCLNFIFKGMTITTTRDQMKIKIYKTKIRTSSCQLLIYQLVTKMCIKRNQIQSIVLCNHFIRFAHFSDMIDH